MTTPLVEVARVEVLGPPPAALTRNPAAPILQVCRLNSRCCLPEYKTTGAAGMDLAACLPEDHPEVMIRPGEVVKVPTGLAMAVPPGYEAQVRARSGLSSKHAIAPVNAPGTIDSDYRGEVIVPLINLGRDAFVVTHGLRMAQLVIAPVARVAVVEVEGLDETVRGGGGFGSTGSG